MVFELQGYGLSYPVLYTYLKHDDAFHSPVLTLVLRVLLVGFAR